MKKILIGVALGFATHRVTRSKTVREFFRKKAQRIAGKIAVGIVTDMVNNGMTSDETTELTRAMKTMTDVIKRRSSSHLKLVKDA